MAGGRLAAASAGCWGIYARVYGWFGERVKWLVRGWRRVDARYLRPLPDRRRAAWQRVAPADYPWFVPLLAAILVFAVTVGPNPLSGTRVSYGLAALGLVLMLAWHEAVRRFPGRRFLLLNGYLAILLALGGLVVAASFLDPSLRLHVGPAMALALAAMLLAASRVAGRIVRRVEGETMQSALPWVELFPPKDRGDFTGDTPGVALVSIGFLVVLRYPVQIVLPPALVALVVPSGSLLWPCLAAGFLAWLAVVLGVLFDRLMELLETIGRLFFIGPQLILSVVVILVAAARWAGIHYVNYLFDKPGGNGTVAFYVLFAYAVAWFYGFWCEILLTRRFIRVLANDDAPVSEVRYDFLGDKRASRVDNERRTIALHGAGRLMVEGDYEPKYRKEQGIREGQRALTFLTPAELLTEFRVQLEDKGWPPAEGARTGKDPLPRVRDLQRAVYAFPGVTAALIIACLGVPLWAGYRWTSQPPELDIVWDAHINLPVQPMVLGTGLVRTAGDRCPALAPLEPRIAVAASGGGTRAAIYTAAVLRGLARQGRICKVVLTSGVSGGSAALAYFALNQDKLRVPLDAFDEDAWDAFDAAMARPYIQEVLDEAGDISVVFGSWGARRGVCGEFMEEPDGRSGGWMPARLRIGNLLAESFVCEMSRPYRDAGGASPEWGMMKQVRFGLILNTGLAGQFSPPERSPDGQVREQAREARGDPIRRSDVAGGRLLLTNIPEPRAARRMSSAEGTRDLRFYTINDPEMSVARAAALSANFPPVFPDAAIDERRPDRDARFWVTDGGTVENRGTVTLYLAIQDAIEPRGDEPRMERERLDRARWPDLHVVIADVSAAGGPYEEGFGLGPLQWASSRMGLALEAELLEDLRAAYAGHHASFSVHELPMPGLLREAIGTHWMMPNGIDLANPAADGDVQPLSQEEARTLVSSLFTGLRGSPSDAVERVWPWTCVLAPGAGDVAAVQQGGPTPTLLPHAAAWTDLMAALVARDRSPCATTRYAGTN